MYKCSLADFSIDEAFEVSEVLSAFDYVAVSCAVKRDDRWVVEILDESPIDEHEIYNLLKNKEFYVEENAKLADVNWLQKCFENLNRWLFQAFTYTGRI